MRKISFHIPAHSFLGSDGVQPKGGGDPSVMGASFEPGAAA